MGFTQQSWHAKNNKIDRVFLTFCSSLNVLLLVQESAYFLERAMKVAKIDSCTIQVKKDKGMY